MIITLIAYKPDSADYCCGYLEQSWSSDFQISEFDNIQQASEELARFYILNKNLDRKEEAYEFKILVDGSEGHIIEDTILLDYIEQIQADVTNKANEIFNEKIEAENKRKEREEVQKKKDEEIRKKKTMEEQERKEKAEYERLKAKYEKPSSF